MNFIKFNTFCHLTSIFSLTIIQGLHKEHLDSIIVYIYNNEKWQEHLIISSHRFTHKENMSSLQQENQIFYTKSHEEKQLWKNIDNRGNRILLRMLLGTNDSQKTKSENSKMLHQSKFRTTIRTHKKCVSRLTMSQGYGESLNFSTELLLKN